MSQNTNVNVNTVDLTPIERAVERIAGMNNSSSSNEKDQLTVEIEHIRSLLRDINKKVSSLEEQNGQLIALQGTHV